MAAHRYWRLLLSQSVNSTQPVVGEIAFATSPGGANVATGGVASASKFDTGFEADKSFDGNASTYWRVSGYIVSGGVGLGNEWIQYDLGAGNAKDVVEMRIGFPSTPGTQTAPRAFTLYWSDDGLNFTRQRSWCEQSFANNETKTYDTTAIPSGQITNRRVVDRTLRYNLAALPQVWYGTIQRAPGIARYQNGTRPWRLTPFTGKKRIAGTTTSLGQPIARRVDLLEQKSGLLVDRRFTGPDGAYEFKDIADTAYTVIGVDNSLEQNSVIFAHVTPVD
ncbi:discoidin domain-containing protein [Pseudomonas aeruginosa]|nr:discoidin domain-containing protein [Pseudomonas aeruginosa]MBG4718175.1 discoidin domain-containing protein [Pseudomonas aeruginosa]